jgi:hypothetical protein
LLAQLDNGSVVASLDGVQSPDESLDRPGKFRDLALELRVVDLEALAATRTGDPGVLLKTTDPPPGPVATMRASHWNGEIFNPMFSHRCRRGQED